MKLEKGYWLPRQWHKKWLMIGLAIVFKQQASLFLKQYLVSLEWSLKNFGPPMAVPTRPAPPPLYS